jgi:hypothetical protein
MRIVAVIAATAALLVLPGAAAGQAPAADSVVGDAFDCSTPTNCIQGEGLFVDAHSGPSGEAPGGTLRNDTVGSTPAGSSTFEGEVTCLSVSGRVAVVGFTGMRQFGGAVGIVVPEAGFARIADRGGPNSGQDTFELTIVAFGDLDGPPIPGPTDCSSFPPAAQTFVNDQGDFVVTDAVSAPASKGQCKKGGWRDFGGMFKNQGQCVAFVQRGPQP